MPCELIPEDETDTGDSQINIAGQKILVVDDDTTQLRLMKELLERAGANVVTEANSLTALKLLNEQRFNCIITDLQMPVLDGFGLVEEIRRSTDDAINKLPVIALSGRRDLDDNAFTSRGFTTRLNKPVNVQQLIKAIGGEEAKDTLPEVNATKAAPKLYDLRSLAPFTQNDPASLKLIIDTFIESTADNCTELMAAARENDLERLALIAHKMIPMLLQMEVQSIAELLSPLEEKTILLENPEMIKYCADIEQRLGTLCSALHNEVAV